MLRSTEEALQCGRSTLLAMDQQDEILSASEQNLESNEHIIQQSMRVVRGMTWSGYFYNMIHSEPSLDANRARSEHRRVDDGDEFTKYSRVCIVISLFSVGRSWAGGVSTARHRAARSHTSGSEARFQDQALDAVSKNLAELHHISLTMGESLDHQNQKLDTIAAKTDKVNDDTLQVLLKSSQLIDRHSSVVPMYLGEYCFELHTGGYLAVQDELLVIGPPMADLTTTFRCYSKGDNIFGMLSSRTMKYLSTGYFTPISVSGVQFNRAAQMHIDLSGEYNGMLMLSCNWGSGGWL
ncbi:unnamed protein product, partial [Ectocarpus fasciculatus]